MFPILSLIPRFHNSSKILDTHLINQLIHIWKVGRNQSTWGKPTQKHANPTKTELNPGIWRQCEAVAQPAVPLCCLNETLTAFLLKNTDYLVEKL